jgi:serine/threonine protein kinase
MPPAQIGRYEIIGELGRGAMGVVYKARDPLIGRTVAIKTVALELSRDEADAFEQRFYREATSAGRLNHSNIVTIHDVGKSESVAYIAMEFLQGRSLREILDSGVVLPFERIADIVAQVADGLAFAHEHGIVHRDIKPPNVMVLDSGWVKITDFGIALLPTGSRTLAGTVFGSPKYMAPEQVVGSRVDGRADIFSLGAVLYEMLTGVPPFFGGELNAVLYQVINELPAAPSSRNPSIPPAFDYIVAKAMAKHPDDRYASAQAMAFDLRHVGALQQPVSGPPAARTLERRAVRRRKGETTASVASAPAVTTSEAATTAATEASAVLRERRNLVVFGVPIALLVVVTASALLARHAPNRAPAVATRVEATTATVVPAVVGLDAARPSNSESEPPVRSGSSVAEDGSNPPRPAASAVPGGIRPLAHLAFAVSPWGVIYVDGRKIGVAPPLTEIKLAPGRHTIEIRNTTYSPYAQTVELEAATRLKIRHKFQ